MRTGRKRSLSFLNDSGTNPVILMQNIILAGRGFIHVKYTQKKRFPVNPLSCNSMFRQALSGRNACFPSG